MAKKVTCDGIVLLRPGCIYYNVDIISAKELGVALNCFAAGVFLKCKLTSCGVCLNYYLYLIMLISLAFKIGAVDITATSPCPITATLTSFIRTSKIKLL